MITKENELLQLCRYALEKGRMTLDTEFFWERTFYPQLGIIQIGFSDTELHLVDAVALPELPGLGAVLADPKVELILHDAIQDLQILCRHTGSRPCRVFDTRRAAGFAGHLSTISLSNLLKDALDVHLAKEHTRSNWLQRPLSDEQQEYALDDIRYLPELCDTIREKADALGNRAALDEEMRMYDDSSLYDEPDSSNIFQRHCSPRFNSKQQALLFELVDWRESEARRLDRPRNHILKNQDLIKLVQRCPVDPDHLQKIEGVSPTVLQRHRQPIETAIRNAAQNPRHPSPGSAETVRLSASVRHRIEEQRNAIIQQAVSEGIDPAMVGTKADMTAWSLYVMEGVGNAPPAFCQGWRKTLLENLMGRKNIIDARKQLLPLVFE